MAAEDDLVYRLRKRAEIRRQIPGRKSVQEGKPDRMADLLDEAAEEIEILRKVASRPCRYCAKTIGRHAEFCPDDPANRGRA
jgi:hypothetical protein